MEQKGTDVVRLSGEDDNFVKLREICKEVVDTRTFCSPPTMLALVRTQLLLHHKARKLRTSQTEVIIRSSSEMSRVYGF